MLLSLDSFFSVGEYACEKNKGSIGYRSCDGLKSCSGNIAQIGIMAMTTSDVNANDEPEGSCQNEAKVEDDVEDPSNYLGACAENTALIGDASCIGNEVCYENNESIGDSSCRLQRACYQNKGGIGNGSCRSPFAW